MQYVVGTTLDDILSGRGIDVDSALDLGTQIAEGLAEAHSHGIIHRDIKPANIIVSEKGQAKILDFGLAKFIEAEASTDAANRMESTSGAMGTVPYMSPEQLLGERVDARTDVFSFGTMLFELISGVSAFGRENNSETISAILNEEPDWSLVHSVLRPMLQRCLARDQGGRYASAVELAEALLKIRNHGPIENPTRPSPAAPIRIDAVTQPADLKTLPLYPWQSGADKLLRPSHNSDEELPSTSEGRLRGWLAVAAGVVTLFTLAGGAFLWQRTLPVNGSTDGKTYDQLGSIQSGIFTTRLTSTGRVKNAAISPDGRFFIYAQEENEAKQSLWMQQIGSGRNDRIIPPANVNYLSLVITSDGNSFYYHDANGTLYRMPVIGGTPTRIADGLAMGWGPSRIAVSPDGLQIAFVRNVGNARQAIIRSDANGANEQTLASIEPPDHIGQTLAWSPDGKVIACWIISDSNLQNIIAVQVADGTYARLPQAVGPIGSLTWLPDSRSLLITGMNGIRKVSYPDGETTPITADSNIYNHLNISADGRSLLTVRTETLGQIWTATIPEGKPSNQLTEGFEKVDGRFVLDWVKGDRIFYDSVASGTYSIWAMDADGSNQQQLVRDVNWATASPDGRYLVYLGQGLNFGLSRMDLRDGSLRNLTDSPDFRPIFSPDGKWVVFQRSTDLWKIPIDGGRPTRIVEEPFYSPAISPDGKTVAAMGSGKIVLVPFDGGEIIGTLYDVPMPSSNGTSTIRWTPDGHGIYYVVLHNRVSNIWKLPIDGSPPVQVTNFESGRIFNFALSPNGDPQSTVCPFTRLRQQ